VRRALKTINRQKGSRIRIKSSRDKAANDGVVGADRKPTDRRGATRATTTSSSAKPVTNEVPASSVRKATVAENGTAVSGEGVVAPVPERGHRSVARDDTASATNATTASPATPTRTTSNNVAAVSTNAGGGVQDFGDLDSKITHLQQLLLDMRRNRRRTADTGAAGVSSIGVPDTLEAPPSPNPVSSAPRTPLSIDTKQASDGPDHSPRLASPLYSAFRMKHKQLSNSVDL